MLGGGGGGGGVVSDGVVKQYMESLVAKFDIQ